MSNAHDQLGQFLGARFPGLTLPAVTDRNGAFPSLRFELGGGLAYDTEEESDKRVDHAAASAVAVFEAAFAPGDDGFVSFTRWTEQDDDLFLALLPPGCDLGRTDGDDFYEQNEPDTPYVVHTARLSPRSLDYRSLFELTASSDLRGHRSPSLDGRCYVVNTTTPLIFHMYDDRGAVVVATQDGDLDGLRVRFGHLIIP